MSGSTVPVGDDEVTARAVGAFIAEAAGADEVEIGAISRLAGGAVQENYALDARIVGGGHHGEHQLVLRTDAPSAVATSLTRATEFAVLQAAFEAGVKVPEPLWSCDDRALIGRPFYLMRRLPGVAAGHRLVRDRALDPRRDALLSSVGAELARIHRIRPPWPGLEELEESPPVPALARVEELRAHLDRMGTAQPVLEWGLRWLERHPPPIEEIVLTHGDYRTGNYLVHDGTLSGVLDWEFARFGDAYEDLGWLCARCWRFGRLDREAGGMGDREPFYRGYEAVAGRPVDRHRVAYFEVLAAVRWAVIALMQADRHLRGEQSSLELALTGRMVPEMELDVLLELDAIRTGAR